MFSSTPLKKGISATVVLITQLGSVVYWLEWNEEVLTGRGSSLTGTMFKWFVDIRWHLLRLIHLSYRRCHVIYMRYLITGLLFKYNTKVFYDNYPNREGLKMYPFLKLC